MLCGKCETRRSDSNKWRSCERVSVTMKLIEQVNSLLISRLQYTTTKDNADLSFANQFSIENLMKFPDFQ